MHVAQIARRFTQRKWGGAETVILETSRRLAQRGCVAKIFCTQALDPTPRETLDGLEIRRAPYFYPYWGLSAANRLRLDQAGGNLFSFALARLLRDEPRLDLLHAHTANRLGGLARHVARRRGVPYVVSLHGGWFDVPAGEHERLAEPTRGAWEWGRVLGWWYGSRRVLADAAAILCVSRREERLLRERFPHKDIVYLPNGVCAERFAVGDGARFRRLWSLPPEAPLLLCVARIDPQKNQELLLRAFASLRHEWPDLHLALVGPVTDEAYAARLRGLASELDCAGQTRFVPGLPPGGDELRDAYHAASVFALPSRHEPFGIVILEAWAAGLPVVASRVGGVPALVDERRDALGFASDNLAELTSRLREPLRRPALAQQLAAAGQRKAREEYGWDALTERLHTLYEQKAREHAHRRR